MKFITIILSPKKANLSEIFLCVIALSRPKTLKALLCFAKNFDNVSWVMQSHTKAIETLIIFYDRLLLSCKCNFQIFEFFKFSEELSRNLSFQKFPEFSENSERIARSEHQVKADAHVPNFRSKPTFFWFWAKNKMMLQGSYEASMLT